MDLSTGTALFQSGPGTSNIVNCQCVSLIHFSKKKFLLYCYYLSQNISNNKNQIEREADRDEAPANMEGGLKHPRIVYYDRRRFAKKLCIPPSAATRVGFRFDPLRLAKRPAPPASGGAYTVERRCKIRSRQYLRMHPLHRPTQILRVATRPTTVRGDGMFLHR